MKNTDEIINWLNQQAQNKAIVSTDDLLRAAHNLNLFLADEQEELFVLQQKNAMLKAEKILEGKSVAMAKALVEATDDYRNMLSLKARIGRIEEFIKISKIGARLKSEEMRSGF